MMEYDNETILSIEDIKKIVNDLLKDDDYYNINKIVLFGSYARGEAETNSDIDLLVCNSPEFGGMKNFAFINELKDKFLKEVELFIDRNINQNSKLYNNILNEGIVIYGE